jgi:uncharacterized protein
MMQMHEHTIHPQHPVSRGALAPVPANERAPWLDALRGFALFGILLANIPLLGGVGFASPEVLHTLRFDVVAPAIDWFEHAFIAAKFYSLFSFLFGLGFALQLRRARGQPLAVAAMQRRRMGWLLVIGLTHAWLIWWGDILCAYAVLGFALLCFRNISQRALLGWAIFFIASPILIYTVFLAVGLPDPFAADPAAPPKEPMVVTLTRAFSQGDYFDVVRSNLIMNAGGWMRRALRLALPRIFGMFLLGAWVARLGLPEARAQYAPMFRRWLLAAVVIGLPLNIGFTALGSGDALLPATTTGLLAITLGSIGIPLLCLGYVAVFALYWRDTRQDRGLVAAGRMALSNYLLQSIVCAAVFYHLGGGLWGKLGRLELVLAAIVLFTAQMWLSRAWLARHRMGPMEWLWRRLAYRGNGAPAAD